MRVAERRRGRARGLRLAVPALVVLIGLGAGCGSDGKKANAGSSTSSTSPLAGAVLAAKAGLPSVLPDGEVQGLVRDLCTAADGGDKAKIVDELLALPLTGPNDLADTVTALGKGAQVYCPAGVVKSPALLREVYDAVTLAAVTSTTSTTALSGATGASDVTGTTAAGQSVEAVTATAPCSPVGLSGVTSTGYPMTCSAKSCAGDSYDQPRWRATNC